MSLSSLADVDWNTTPAGIAPDGQKGDLSNPPSVSHRITASNVTCAFFVVLTVALRLYTRMHIVRGLGADDYALLLATFFWICLVVTLEVLPSYGLGRHIWNVSLAEFSPGFLLLRIFAAIFYTASMFCIKISLLMLYRRVFDIDRFFKRWWFVMAYTIAHTLTAILLSWLACRPPAAQWDLHITHRKCISPASLISIPVFHCVNDILILSLPIPLVWKLNLNRRRKVQVIIIFALGSASCIVSILRLWPITKLVRQPRFGDVTWYWTPVAIWTQVELTFCIMCACVPVLKPFLSRHFPACFSSDSNPRNTAERIHDDSPPNDVNNQNNHTGNIDNLQRVHGSDPTPRGGRRPGAIHRNPSTKTIGQISTRLTSLRHWSIRSGALGREDVVDIELGLSGSGSGGGRGGSSRGRGLGSRAAGGGAFSRLGSGGAGDTTLVESAMEGMSGSTRVGGASSSRGGGGGSRDILASVDDDAAGSMERIVMEAGEREAERHDASVTASRRASQASGLQLGGAAAVLGTTSSAGSGGGLGLSPSPSSPLPTIDDGVFGATRFGYGDERGGRGFVV